MVSYSLSAGGGFQALGEGEKVKTYLWPTKETVDWRYSSTNGQVFPWPLQDLNVIGLLAEAQLSPGGRDGGGTWEAGEELVLPLSPGTNTCRSTRRWPTRWPSYSTCQSACEQKWLCLCTCPLWAGCRSSRTVRLACWRSWCWSCSPRPTHQANMSAARGTLAERCTSSVRVSWL